MEQKLLEIIANRLKVDIDRLREDTNIMEDLDADSLDVIEIVMEVERQFDIRIPDDDILTIKTVGEADNYLREKSNQRI